MTGTTWSHEESPSHAQRINAWTDFEAKVNSHLGIDEKLSLIIEENKH